MKYMESNQQWSYSPQWEQRLENWCLQHVGREKFKDGMDRLRRVLDYQLQRFMQQKMKVVIVGGSNGKGETVYHLSHLLCAAKIRHALFVSPHVLSVCERISVDGELIAYPLLEQRLQREFARAQDLGQGLSYYELMLAAFFDFVNDRRDPPLEVCVVEVGLGGQLLITFSKR
ncbi:MAG: hypothetical protein HQK53_18760, partial [Oligoflexia bacterium]|nr:hypothetical protein [Oligoflexia bacterium]